MHTLIKFKSNLRRLERSPARVLRSLTVARKKSASEEMFLDRSCPFFKPVSHFLNPMFLTNFNSYDSFSQFPWVLSQDGAYSLTEFFMRFSRPGNNLNTILLIQEDLSSLVPTAWQDHVLYYRLSSIVKKSPSELAEVLFLGITNNFFCSLDQVEKEVLKVKSTLSHISKYMFCPILRDSIYLNDRDAVETDNFRYLELLKDHFKDFLSLATFKDIERQNLLHNSAHIILQRPQFISSFSYPDIILERKRSSDITSTSQVFCRDPGVTESDSISFPFTIGKTIELFSLAGLKDNSSLWQEFSVKQSELGVTGTIYNSEFIYYFLNKFYS